MSERKDNSDVLPTTPSQTVGPFPHEAWQWLGQATAAPGEAALVIEGRLLDGQGEPINDGWIEAWTAPHEAQAAAEAMTDPAAPPPGFQRCATDEQGRYALHLPGRPALAGRPAAYVTVFARGLSLHQHSAVFLADDGDAALAGSALLRQLPAERRACLLAHPAEAPRRYRWDIRLQGGPNEETVFFDYA
ncbi:MAG: protocatechuate 3,4-dioxygenase [Burkholderiaceae bacterium]